MKIYFIRHGKTEWNLESRYQGAGGDSPLLKTSYQEMDQLAAFFRAVKFEHVFASPIKRARITAERIRHQLEVVPEISLWNRLEEFHLGKMEGQKFTDVQKQFPEQFNNFREHPEKYDNHEIGGETFQQVVARIIPAVEMITSDYPRDDQKVMIVSHGAALNALINSLLGEKLADLRKRGGLSNTSTTILETKDQGQTFSLVKWNDTQYLSRKLDSTDTI
ncbi:histidine phosphatase family protein [Nicoliella spurrieriana]|uniref:Histidine phosphatase family protein n=1 Tax=Nicoliella spurrieriana TaxID=2925830 RepID=A0A976RRE2_9LACO|nr:histidine phosphatase family protein [Nicoliella spurrieriana]UQS86449.1 histidine phosphatase family protein [Nicoliella spurrieriana]